jgi:hypothetical protein
MIENRFCRDVEVEAETEREAIAKATAADWDEEDWCDGHELEVVGVSAIEEE